MKKHNSKDNQDSVDNKEEADKVIPEVSAMEISLTFLNPCSEVRQEDKKAAEANT